MKSKSKSGARKSGERRRSSGGRRVSYAPMTMAVPMDYSPTIENDGDYTGAMRAFVTLIAFGVVVFLGYRLYEAWTAPSGAEVNSALSLLQALNPFATTTATVQASAWDDMISRERTVITPIAVIATLLFFVMLYRFYS